MAPDGVTAGGRTMTNVSLVNDFEAYSQWRSELSRRISDYRSWLGKEDLNDSQRDLRCSN
jgi:hypothetical protein